MGLSKDERNLGRNELKLADLRNEHQVNHIFSNVTKAVTDVPEAFSVLLHSSLHVGNQNTVDEVVSISIRPIMGGGGGQGI